jgi:hypothetical protein
MQPSQLLGRRPRVGTLLLALAVAVVAVAAVVNGVSEVRNNHGTKRDIARFNSYLENNVGRAGFGRPRVKLHRRFDTVCATHRKPTYQLCTQLSSKTGKVESVYKIVRGPGGRLQRQPF